MYISIPRSANKSYLHNLAKKYLGTYLILKDGVWYKVTKQYSSVKNKLVYLGETEEVFTLGIGTPYVIEDEQKMSNNKILGKLIANIETDEDAINQHIDECLQKIEDTWSDVSVDYSGVEEYFLELVDVDSWVSKNWITFSVELKES